MSIIKRPLPASQATIIDRVVERPVTELLSRFRRSVTALKDRAVARRLPRHPCVYSGTLQFNPESTAVALDTLQTGAGTKLVNYIVRSGQDYQVPILITGDGVFEAHKIRVKIRQRFFYNATGWGIPIWLGVVPSINQFSPDGNPDIAWTTKFSVIPTQPAVANPNTDVAPTTNWPQGPAINYRWNLRDPLSGIQYSDRPLPMSALMPRTFININGVTGSPTANSGIGVADGDFHTFDVPWPFTQSRQPVFIFRPVTDIVQYDSSLFGSSIGMSAYDDREGGQRYQPVVVQVELIGERVGGTP